MALKNKLIAAGLAAAAIMVTTAAASAAPAVATSNVNVRSGPGTGFAVVDALRRGERVDVQYCRGSWCYVQKAGPDGWVSSSYLSSGRPSWNDDWGWDDGGWNNPRPPRPPHWNPRPPRPPHWNPRPPRPQPVYPSNPSASMCFNGPNGYFCMGT
ncbi:Uncharacterized conserved protein YraI [Devosia lucknowensis]|uniref:Uncharacterized conserved protein YraI n=1 Tax=Devosia lucknowensis TaxID=1096929 RepID=A0A1Y6FFA6_9HYPH|nr:SH3 domain-containing protein [Devosia lucknowensis]SMQ71083.1 Uncharacterized conserved protein YraI [Devosia lucknowensis]